MKQVSAGRVGRHGGLVAAANWFAFDNGGDINGSFCSLAHKTAPDINGEHRYPETTYSEVKGYNSNSISRSGLSVMSKHRCICRHVD